VAASVLLERGEPADRTLAALEQHCAMPLGAVDFLEGEFDLDTPDDLKRSTAFTGTAKWCPKLDP
jgi:hypothetical protein